MGTTASDREAQREVVKVVLRWRMKGPLDSHYRNYFSPEVARRSREALLNECADDVLRMLGLHHDEPHETHP